LLKIPSIFGGTILQYMYTKFSSAEVFKKWSNTSTPLWATTGSVRGLL
jgi:hypothetical protein